MVKKCYAIVCSIILVILAILVIALLSDASAHGPDVPKWLSHNSKYQTTIIEERTVDVINPLTNKIEQERRWLIKKRDCCGPRDCKPIDEKDYKIMPDGSAEVNFRDTKFKIAKSSIQMSEDAISWFCAAGRDHYDTKYVQPLCLFPAPKFTLKE